ncbi:MAG: tRNA (adenosine(37)-N6)-dimethylallyltransferase MiaA [Bacteroidales bacterium]|nr:tRNA (adenosine(37)-N6)-dimethylallyltransferase MiaA [Bacteroidales bacterium]MDD4673301.1 tRNA (adenosine(37)-N6)-dimethylallyltransferase MiaA [Bacteroidales bacterium]
MSWNPNSYNLVTILGPTAGGKTSVAAHLAHNIGGEVISGDSRQIYRGMNLGTGKDLHDYVVNGKPVPYHLIDIVDAGYRFNVYEYQTLFIDAFSSITERGVTPILCGGSGLYLEAAIKGYRLIQVPNNLELREELATKSHEELVSMLASMKPLHNHTDTENRKRLVRAIEIETYYANTPQLDFEYPNLHNIVFGVRFPRMQQRERITQRLRQRLSEGMVDEVKLLLEKGVDPDILVYYGLEYKWLTQFVLGQISYNEMFEGLNTAIHQFAKRQMTWFRRMERNGIDINWIDGNLPMEQKLEFIFDTLRK